MGQFLTLYGCNLVRDKHCIIPQLSVRISFMDTCSEQQQDGVRIMRHTYFRFGICDAFSQYANEACEGKEFGWIWEERDGSNREVSA